MGLTTIREEPKTAGTHVYIGTKFRVKPKKSRNSCGLSRKGISKIKPKNFVNEMSNMLETNLTKASNFIRTSLSSMN